jgi:hypothetical protein
MKKLFDLTKVLLSLNRRSIVIKEIRIGPKKTGTFRHGAMEEMLQLGDRDLKFLLSACQTNRRKHLGMRNENSS